MSAQPPPDDSAATDNPTASPVYDEFRALLAELKAAREAKGQSLADPTDLTGMDRSALLKLETGQRPNPTLETCLLPTSC